ncbi:MAG: cheE protein [Phenylobacterium sp.]|nr:cheE protein [Phenylobacterium sp.]
MKPGNVFKYENRLAKSMVTRGGMTAAEAMKAAQAAVEEVREPTLAEIDANLAEIYGLCDQLKDGTDEAALKRMYVCANRVVAMGGVFGLGELGKAAYSLCELVSRFQTLDRFQWSMIRVHMDGLRLLRTPDEHVPEHREQVLAGLRQVATSVV